MFEMFVDLLTRLVSMFGGSGTRVQWQTVHARWLKMCKLVFQKSEGSRTLPFFEIARLKKRWNYLKVNLSLN